MQNSQNFSRRSFLKTTGAVAGAAVLTSGIARTAHAAGDDLIRVVLVGCGGRGTGAVNQILSTDGNCKLVAVADAFDYKAEGAVKNLAKAHGDKVDVPKERQFAGIDAFKKAIDCDCDLVVIATPPGFRPMQFEYAVEKGRHIFMEKPLAVDAPGIVRNIETNKKAKEKNLMVAIGLQRRHEPNYMETVKRLQDGAIGNINLLRVYWNGGGIWYRGKEDSQTEAAFQCNNWYHFIWASGDQICEQHIHNLDVGLWVKGDQHPVEANGMGGRECRLGGDRTKSQIFDHTFVEYTFADGTKMYSQGRHLGNAFGQVAEFAHGDKGTANPGGSYDLFDGEKWSYRGQRVSGHQQEQTDLVASLSKGEIYNEGDYGIQSTYCAILGREACYSGKVIKWDELLEKGRNYAPELDSLTLDSPAPAPKDDEGKYYAPVPGEHNPFA